MTATARRGKHHKTYAENVNKQLQEAPELHEVSCLMLSYQVPSLRNQPIIRKDSATGVRSCRVGHHLCVLLCVCRVYHHRFMSPWCRVGFECGRVCGWGGG